MQYYKIIPKIGEGKNANASISFTGLPETELSNLLRGRKASEVNDKAIEVKNFTKEFPDLMGTGSSEFFITDRFKTIIEKLEPSSNLHFIPVTYHKRNYWLLNILNNIPCFDWDRSEYITRENNPKALKKVTKLAVKQDGVGKRNIFRMEEQYMYVLISQNLKDAIEANNLTGIAYDNTFEIITT